MERMEARMPLHVIDNGENNHLDLDQAVAQESNGTIVFQGSGNSVCIQTGSSTYALSMTLQNNCHFLAGPDCRMGALEVFAASDVRIAIGDSSFFTDHTRIYSHEAASVRIGQGCLIASNTLITTSDMHSIIDLDTGERINRAEDVILEDEVWLGANATVLKGAWIGKGSIIGLGSLVTGSIPAYSLAVGAPARVIRSRVTWRPGLL
jgi:acetyltransferase-like isoleucine patch superfamily enzyme